MKKKRPPHSGDPHPIPKKKILNSERAHSRPLRDLPPSLRPRERLASLGPKLLSDAELLATLLRTGTAAENAVELAQRILIRFGGLSELVHLHLKEWLEVQGVGRTKAITVMAAFELGQRALRGKVHDQPLSDPEAVFRYVLPCFVHENRECLYVLGLDAKNHPAVLSLVGAGTVDRAPGHPREVFQPLIRSQATRAILCHNHLSGDPEPSPHDLELTRRLVQCGELLGIPIIDHIIVASSRYISLRERGYIA